MRRLIFLVAPLFALSLQAQVTIQTGNTLADLITNLYGGNGIQLKTTGHQAHFGASEDFQQFSAALQKTLQSRPVFPLPSSVGIVSYRFNEETGTYERVQSAFGPILAERASTSGRGHANFSSSYTFSDFENFDGEKMIPLTVHHCMTDACTFGHPESPYLRDVIRIDAHLKLKTQALVTSVVYGATDRLDIGIIVPYVRNDLNVFTHAFVVADPETFPGTHVFDLAVETPDQLAIGHSIGIGDIVLRAKSQLPLKLPVQTAILADVTLPTGDAENFLGTGDLRLKATFIASKTGTRFVPHMNVGYEWNTKTSKLSTFDARLGTEVAATKRLTLAADLLGTVSPSTSEGLRVRALEGRTLVARSQIDSALGAKWQLTPRSLLLMNMLLPMNQDGIRPNSVITFGVQAGL